MSARWPNGPQLLNTAMKWRLPIKISTARIGTTDPAAQKDAFGQEVPNAGWLWVKKMAQNHPVVVDEIDVAYASVGMDPKTEPGMAGTGWNSVEDTAAGDIVMAPAWRWNRPLAWRRPATWP